MRNVRPEISNILKIPFLGEVGIFGATSAKNPVRITHPSEYSNESNCRMSFYIVQ